MSGISGRYATALFELAVDNGQLDAVASDLAGIEKMLAESEDMVRLIRSPLLGREDQARGIAAVLERAGCGELVSRFAGVLAQNRRLFVLPKAILDFRTLLARHRGETIAEVISATPLADAQLEQIRKSLSQAAGRDVVMNTKVDEALIGGLVVKLGSRMIDGSIRSKLKNLQLAMKGVG
ncbi:MAG: F0F1 ATP synthase subunit delta [Sneathiellaceae bacterium]